MVENIFISLPSPHISGLYNDSDQQQVWVSVNAMQVDDFSLHLQLHGVSYSYEALFSAIRVSDHHQICGGRSVVAVAWDFYFAWSFMSSRTSGVT